MKRSCNKTLWNFKTFWSCLSPGIALSRHCYSVTVQFCHNFVNWIPQIFIFNELVILIQRIARCCDNVFVFPGYKFKKTYPRLAYVNLSPTADIFNLKSLQKDFLILLGNAWKLKIKTVYQFDRRNSCLWSD